MKSGHTRVMWNHLWLFLFTWYGLIVIVVCIIFNLKVKGNFNEILEERYTITKSSTITRAAQSFYVLMILFRFCMNQVHRLYNSSYMFIHHSFKIIRMTFCLPFDSTAEHTPRILIPQKITCTLCLRWLCKILGNKKKPHGKWLEKNCLLTAVPAKIRLIFDEIKLDFCHSDNIQVRHEWER